MVKDDGDAVTTAAGMNWAHSRDDRDVYLRQDFGINVVVLSISMRDKTEKIRI